MNYVCARLHHSLQYSGEWRTKNTLHISSNSGVRDTVTKLGKAGFVQKFRIPNFHRY